MGLDRGEVMTRGEQYKAAAFLRECARGKTIGMTTLAEMGNEFAIQEIDRAAALIYAAEFLVGCADNTDDGKECNV